MGYLNLCFWLNENGCVDGSMKYPIYDPNLFFRLRSACDKITISKHKQFGCLEFRFRD